MSDVQGEAPWFWKIFGGTILGMITLLLITIFGNLRNEISDNKRELLIQVNELRVDIRQDRDSVSLFKERLVAIEQAYSKEKLSNIDSLLATQKEKLAALEALISTGKDEFKIVREEIKDIVKQTQEVREKVAALTPVVSEIKTPTTVKP